MCLRIAPASPKAEKRYGDCRTSQDATNSFLPSFLHLHHQHQQFDCSHHSTTRNNYECNILTICGATTASVVYTRPQSPNLNQQFQPRSYFQSYDDYLAYEDARPQARRPNDPVRRRPPSLQSPVARSSCLQNSLCSHKGEVPDNGDSLPKDVENEKKFEFKLKHDTQASGRVAAAKTNLTLIRSIQFYHLDSSCRLSRRSRLFKIVSSALEVQWKRSMPIKNEGAKIQEIKKTSSVTDIKMPPKTDGSDRERLVILLISPSLASHAPSQRLGR